jgi:glucose-1-phosphate cytidylyltransferase
MEVKMKAVILAGGLGTRISEETHLKPKPMIEIGGKPILWHIMKIYSQYGVNEFVICLGYKGYLIKEYFANYYLHTSDVTFNLNTNQMDVHYSHSEQWKITLVDTGELSMTGGRIKRIKKYVEGETFFCTYGDGVSNVNLSKLLDYHYDKGVYATLTSCQPSGRYGALVIEAGLVKSFKEKPKGQQGWINGGYFVFGPEIFNYLESDETVLEESPLEILAKNNQLGAYKHHGFWEPMDTLKDKKNLEELWKNNNAPWKVW